MLKTTITVSPDLRSALGALKPEAMLGAIARGMEKGAALMVGAITAERLTGQGPFPVGEHRLGVKSGRLRRSFHWSPARVEEGGVSVGIGAPVEYAAAHEFGFAGTVNVGEYTRRPGVKVRAHTRKMIIPERAPIRTGIREHLDMMETAVADEVTLTMKGDGAA